jgi:hypothetical protein
LIGATAILRRDTLKIHLRAGNSQSMIHLLQADRRM